MMQFVIRNGLNLDNTTVQQMRFISENEILWKASWLSWNLAVTGLFAFSVSLYGVSKKSKYAKVGLLLVFLGLTLDLIAQHMLSYKLSEYAVKGSINDFIATEAIAMKWTGVYANALCNLGGFTLTLILLNEKQLSFSSALIGLLGWSLGLTSSLYYNLNEIQITEHLTAIAMALSLLFMALVNVRCFSRKANV